MENLVAFDFDNTIVKHHPGLTLGVAHHFPEGKIPQDLFDLKAEKGWDAFRWAVYEAVNQLKVGKDALCKGKFLSTFSNNSKKKVFNILRIFLPDSLALVYM
jgi:FMN phosphatase YigB (HAD superfamily)